MARTIGKDSLIDVRSCAISGEISSLSVFSASTLPSTVVAVATWANEILLYTLDHLRSGEPVITSISESFFASSLMLKSSIAAHSPTSGVQLVAGMSDGSMIIYDIEHGNEGGGLMVKGRKASSLGTRPLRLCPVTGASHSEEKIVSVGLSERMSVIFEGRDRIDFSSVSKKVSSLISVLALLTLVRTSQLPLRSLHPRSENALSWRHRRISRLSRSTASRSFTSKLST